MWVHRETTNTCSKTATLHGDTFNINNILPSWSKMKDIYKLCMCGNLMVNMLQYSENLFIVWEEWKRQVSKQLPIKGIRREQSYDAFWRRKSWGSRAESQSEKVRGTSRSPAALRNQKYSSRHNVCLEKQHISSHTGFRDTNKAVKINNTEGTKMERHQ